MENKKMDENDCDHHNWKSHYSLSGKLMYNECEDCGYIPGRCPECNHIDGHDSTCSAVQGLL